MSLSAKSFREVAAGTLFDRVSEIAMGLTPEAYDRNERRAAFAIRNAVERIDRDEPILVPSDPRELLTNADNVISQIDDVKERSGPDQSRLRESAIER